MSDQRSPDLRLDRGPFDRAPLDREPPLPPPPAGEPERCDFIDNDLDGVSDEGVSNPCGGCLPLGERGCEAWGLNLLRPLEGLIDPARVMSLGAQVFAAERGVVEGGECERLTVSLESRSSLGAVTLRAPTAELSLLPTPQPDGQILYRPAQAQEPLRLFEPLERIFIDLEGRPGFRFDIPLGVHAPRAPQLLGEGGLEAIKDQLRGGGESGAPLRWVPSGEDAVEGERLRLYGGGSVPIFNRANRYRALRHYLLNGELEDDGEFQLHEGVSRGVPESAIWVYLSREQLSRWVPGADSLSALTGERVELRESGRLSDAPDPTIPFEFLSPTPDARAVDPSRPLELRWTPPPAPPPGAPEEEGSFSATLLLYDYAAGQGQQLRCVLEPGTTKLTIPVDWLAAWPRGEDTLRQITLTWLRRLRRLPAPDRGRYQEYTSLILRLEELY